MPRSFIRHITGNSVNNYVIFCYLPIFPRVERKYQNLASTVQVIYRRKSMRHMIFPLLFLLYKLSLVCCFLIPSVFCYTKTYFISMWKRMSLLMIRVTSGLKILWSNQLMNIYIFRYINYDNFFRLAKCRISHISSHIRGTHLGRNVKLKVTSLLRNILNFYYSDFRNSYTFLKRISWRCENWFLGYSAIPLQL